MESVNKEALELLIKTCQQAADAEKVDEVKDPRKIVLLKSGEIVTVDVPPPVRQSQVCSLETLIAVAGGEPAKKPVVWHHDGGVALVLNDEDRRDVAVFPLEHSREFAKLIELDTGLVALDQRSFVRMLRQTLGVPAAEVGPFRRIEWSVHKAADGQVEHGKDRLGRDIQAQVGAATPLPEDMLLNVPVYEQRGERERYQVRCDIEIDAIAERLVLVPVAGEIRTVIDQAQASIHERLVEGLDGNIPVYYGQP